MTLAIVDEPEPDVSPMSPAALQLMMEQNHDQAEEGHHRLRADVRELEQRVRAIESMQHAQALQLAKPTDITTLQFPARLVVALCAVCLGLGAGQYVMNARLEAKVITAMDATKSAMEANNRLWDERFSTFQKTLDSTRNRLELLQIEFNTYQKEAARRR